MPQLVPFYFVNETIFAFALILISLYIFSTYLLGKIVRLSISRLFVTKL